MGWRPSWSMGCLNENGPYRLLSLNTWLPFVGNLFGKDLEVWSSWSKSVTGGGI